MTMIRVTNTNTFDLKDQFDGQPYVFPAGQTVVASIDVCRHIFGLGDDDKLPYLARLGWTGSSGDHSEALAKLNNFEFDVVQIDLGAPLAAGVASGQAESAPLHAPSGVDEVADAAEDTPPRASTRGRRRDRSLLEKALSIKAA